jgi:hypothetical protein
MASTLISAPSRPAPDVAPLGATPKGPPGATRPVGPRPPRGHRPIRRRSGALLYAVAFTGYLSTGLTLMLHYGYHAGDAISRTANASYVLFSRDPHLAAIGFVWNPLPSLVEIPILCFSSLWPALLHQGAAGAFMSAAFMAGAVVQLRGILVDRRIGRGWVWGLTAAFALNPLVLLYGGNGLSEAPYLFFSLWAVRRLIRWMHDDRVANLVMAGIALGLDFLTRYETVAIACATALLVGLVTYYRPGNLGLSGRGRRGLALLDSLVVVGPFVLCFVGWALAGWILTGNAFSQFSSVYGNTSQTAVAGGLGTRHLTSSISLIVSNVVLMDVFVLVAIVVAFALAISRRDPDFLPTFAVLGGGVSFVVLSYVTGQTIQNFRYYILLIPMAVLAVGMLPRDQRDGRLLHATRSGTSWHRAGAVLAALVLLVPALPLLVHTMTQPSVDLSDYGIRSVFEPGQYPPADNDQMQAQPYAQKISAYMDAMGLPNSSVLIDSWEGYGIIMTSEHMKQFVITSDYDFTRDVNNPARFGIRYILVPVRSGIGTLDALNRRYPHLYANGGGISTLVLQFDPPIATLGAWRLYQVNAPDHSS